MFYQTLQLHKGVYELLTRWFKYTCI